MFTMRRAAMVHAVLPDIGWATTPITEAGYVRISSNSARCRPRRLSRSLSWRRRLLAGHTFWPDDDITDRWERRAIAMRCPTTVGSPTAISDVLAARYGGRLIAFDAALADPASGVSSRCCSHWDVTLARPVICGAGAPGRTPVGRRRPARSSAPLGLVGGSRPKTVAASASSTNQVRRRLDST